MAPSFVACDREQPFLLPPDVRDWLPEDHFAWFVIDAVDRIDMAAFYAVYREDGRCRPAYEPAMMLALLLYAYARGTRSSRVIERACVEDVAFRVIAAQQRPDHATIARFVERHQRALADVFGAVLGLCSRAGLIGGAVVAIDGTKIGANASRDATFDYERIAREIVEEAIATDRAEDELYGEARGDELPPEISTRQGRQKWLREAQRALDEQRAREQRPTPRPLSKRVQESKCRLEEQLWTECRANEAYEAFRARGVMRNGRRMGPATTPKPYTPPDRPQEKINTTDLDSRLVKGMDGWLQGYNAQAATNEQQIVLAAEVMVSSPDFGHLEPMFAATGRELKAAGVSAVPEVLLADAGYWHQEQMERIMAAGTQVLVPPDSSRRRGKSTRPGWDGGLYAFMRRVLSTDRGGELYGKRQPMIEPVFANTKFNRKITRFHRRGRAAVRTEWRLITATHNLVKLHKHQLAAASA
jgi:transposase